MKRKEIYEPVILTTLKCNRKCLFCLRTDDHDPPHSLNDIKQILRKYKNTISIEGGEPLLSPNVFTISKLLKKHKVREVVLMTNGYLLDKEKIIKLKKCGIDIFSINFPSHIEKIFNMITQTKKQYKKTLTAIKNISELFPYALRLTYIINTLNYKLFKNFILFVKKEIKKIRYIEVNMIKVKGGAKKRLWLIPNFNDIKKHLIEGLKKTDGIKVIMEGFPLCVIKGFEENSIEFYNIIKNNIKYKNYIKTGICKKCYCNKLCPGIRNDYLSIYSDNFAIPYSKREYNNIILKINKL